MGNEILVQNTEEVDEVQSLNYDELEELLEQQFKMEFSNLEKLQIEFKEIGSPDKLSDVILDEIWSQFGNQIGLDMTSDTLLQQYNDKHPEGYTKDIGDRIVKDKRYSITENDKSDSYGRECLTELTKALEDYRDDLVVIVAGYDELMKKFFESNPGLKSRFNYFITFEDYTVDQMFDIFLSYCKNEEYTLRDSAKEKLKKYLELHTNNLENKNANGRFVRNVFDRIIMNQARRLAKLNSDTKENYVTILEEDIF